MTTPEERFRQMAREEREAKDKETDGRIQAVGLFVSIVVLLLGWWFFCASRL